MAEKCHGNDRPPRISVQVDAIHAAGELALEEARKPLLERLEEGIEDEEVFLEIVWALSSIGGEGVRHALEKLLEDTDDDDMPMSSRMPRTIFL